jgi:ferrochelatase
MSHSEKIGVVLFNLGGPDSLEMVKPFLYRLFQDPDLFQFPGSSLVRKPLAYLIASLRARKSRVYFEYMGGKSPITELTLLQAKALDAALNCHLRSPAPSPPPLEGGGKNTIPSPLTGEGQGEGDPEFKVVIAMRYWKPTTDDAIRELQREKIRRVVLLPLYPQYSYTTTRSSERYWQERCRKLKVKFDEEIFVPDYHDHPQYIRSVVERIREALTRLPPEEAQQTHLLFSAHGIPLREIEQGDPYERQICRSVDLVIQELGNGYPHHLSYQSRVGPLKWLEPTTVKMIEKLSTEGVKSLIAVPISFVSDHSETLYELKKLYGELALSRGIKRYELMPALNDHPLFIEALKDLVLKSVKER